MIRSGYAYSFLWDDGNQSPSHGAAWSHIHTLLPATRHKLSPHFSPSQTRFNFYGGMEDWVVAGVSAACVASCRAVLTRVRVIAALHCITGTVDVAPASRWACVNAAPVTTSAQPTRTRSVAARFPAANSRVTRSFMSEEAAAETSVAVGHITATERYWRTARQPHRLLSPYSLRNRISFIAWLAATCVHLYVVEYRNKHQSNLVKGGLTDRCCHIVNH